MEDSIITRKSINHNTKILIKKYISKTLRHDVDGAFYIEYISLHTFFLE